MVVVAVVVVMVMAVVWCGGGSGGGELVLLREPRKTVALSPACAQSPIRKEISFKYR